MTGQYDQPILETLQAISRESKRNSDILLKLKESVQEQRITNTRLKELVGEQMTTNSLLNAIRYEMKEERIKKDGELQNG